MAKVGSAQNQTVEEILASIRQAISDDEAKRSAVETRSTEREPDISPPTESVSSMFAPGGDQRGGPEFANADVNDPHMQEVIDLAIEKALDGVRAELEVGPDEPKVAMTRGSVANRPDPAPATPRPRSGGQMGMEPRGKEPVPGDEPRGQPSLLSPRTGAAVSASFDDLTRSITSGNAGKVEKLVEGILRPMLQTWMDDNLPTLVERLVREEIERVSRGRR